MNNPKLSDDSPALIVINESDLSLEVFPLQALAQFILAEERPSEACFATLLLCDDAQMQNYNQNYRGAHGCTDVLSFPAAEMSIPTSEDTQKTFLGDIVVDTNQADRQKGSRSLFAELQILLVHGLLHLLGYDHIKTQDKKDMEQKENYYIQKLVGA